MMNQAFYVAVNHDYAAIYTGAASIFVAGLPLPVINETATALGVVQGAVDTGMYAGVLGNPYDSIPPYGEQSIHHPAKNVHCMCSDAVAAAQAAEWRRRIMGSSSSNYLLQLQKQLNKTQSSFSFFFFNSKPKLTVY